jgi:hypothetical protein
MISTYPCVPVWILSISRVHEEIMTDCVSSGTEPPVLQNPLEGNQGTEPASKGRCVGEPGGKGREEEAF